MPKSIGICSCPCANKDTIADLLLCAPCPPPILSYGDFRDHALSGGLQIHSVCVIAKRCNIYGIDKNDCPPEIALAVFPFVLLGVLFGLLLLFLFIFFLWRRRRQRTQRFDVVGHDVELSEALNKDKSVMSPQECASENIEHSARLSANVEHSEREDVESDEEIYYPAEEDISPLNVQSTSAIKTDSTDFPKHSSQFDKSNQRSPEKTIPKLISTNQQHLTNSDPSESTGIKYSDDNDSSLGDDDEDIPFIDCENVDCAGQS